MSDLDIFKDYVLCTAEHCSLRSRKPKLYGGIKSRYPKITAAMEKLLYFWVDKSHKPATNSTGIRANWINCLLYILKVLLNCRILVRYIEAISSFKFQTVRSLKEFSSMEQYVKGFQRFHAGEDVRPVTSCKFLSPSTLGVKMSSLPLSMTRKKLRGQQRHALEDP